MIDAEPEGFGLGKEIVNLCLKKNDIGIKYLKLPIKRTHHFMDVGEIDITVYSYKKKREEILYYGEEALFDSEYGFVVRANSGIDISSLSDLKPYVIGHLAGLSYTPALMKIIEDKEKSGHAVTGYSLKAMFAQLVADLPRFAIMSNSKITLQWQAKKQGLTEKVKVLDYKIKNKAYYLTVSKRSKNIDNPKLFLNKVDKCLREIKKTGEYQSILARYGIN